MGGRKKEPGNQSDSKGFRRIPWRCASDSISRRKARDSHVHRRRVRAEFSASYRTLHDSYMLRVHPRRYPVFVRSDAGEPRRGGVTALHVKPPTDYAPYAVRHRPARSILIRGPSEIPLGREGTSHCSMEAETSFQVQVLWRDQPPWLGPDGDDDGSLIFARREYKLGAHLAQLLVVFWARDLPPICPAPAAQEWFVGMLGPMANKPRLECCKST
ncbi:hypothetical protein VNO77_27665 [Canavalia gladiata]|uniref:Uncharacterized protein n=1 Tax=Canavalia gladiata TaxID=3824 RepID=A0AAN9KXB9_CANGL